MGVCGLPELSLGQMGNCLVLAGLESLDQVLESVERSPVTNGPSTPSYRAGSSKTDAGLKGLSKEVGRESSLRKTWTVQGGEAAIDGADIWGWPMALLHVPD